MKNIATLLLLTLTTPAAADQTPNFIIIYADDLGYADTSVQMMDADPETRHDFIQTPGLERLAMIGARFSTAYSPTPTCTGSRLSIQFGMTSARVQYRNVNDVLSKVQRPDGYDDEVSMAAMLKQSDRNYVTAMFGKGCSAMGRFDEAGYDVTDEMPGQPGGNGNGHGSWWDPTDKTPFPPDNPKRIHSLRRDSVAFINRYAGEQPFFLMVSHYAPHIPHMATEEAFERVKERWIAEGRDAGNSAAISAITYAAMIEEMDQTVAAIIDVLAETGELDNTWIIFTSDNGGGNAQRREVEGETRRFNGPLREGKRSVFEGGIRVPTVIAGPGIEAGSQCDVPIVQYDFLSTFHDLSGSDAPLPEGIDGGSLRDVFARGNSGTVNRPTPGIIHHYPCHYHPPISSIIMGDYKFMRQLNSGELRLFNIRTDYREEHDLAGEMPERVEHMDATLRDYVEQVDGGTIQQVRQAMYDLMEESSQRSMERFRRDLAELEEQNPPDSEAQRAALLEALNERLLKNEINSEKCRRNASFNSWIESVSNGDAEQAVRDRWVDVTN